MYQKKKKNKRKKVCKNALELRKRLAIMKENLCLCSFVKLYKNFQKHNNHRAEQGMIIVCLSS